MQWEHPRVCSPQVAKYTRFDNDQSYRPQVTRNAAMNDAYQGKTTPSHLQRTVVEYIVIYNALGDK